MRHITTGGGTWVAVEHALKKAVRVAVSEDGQRAVITAQRDRILELAKKVRRERDYDRAMGVIK